MKLCYNNGWKVILMKKILICLCLLCLFACSKPNDTNNELSYVGKWIGYDEDLQVVTYLEFGQGNGFSFVDENGNNIENMGLYDNYRYEDEVFTLVGDEEVKWSLIYLDENYLVLQMPGMVKTFHRENYEPIVINEAVASFFNGFDLQSEVSNIGKDVITINGNNIFKKDYCYYMFVEVNGNSISTQSIDLNTANNLCSEDYHEYISFTDDGKVDGVIFYR